MRTGGHRKKRGKRKRKGREKYRREINGKGEREESGKEKGMKGRIVGRIGERKGKGDGM